MLDLNYDFTTEAQSKELIRLGVPEWTANCFMLRDDEHQMVYQVPRPYNYTQWKEWGAKKCGDEVIPIWTSGRLRDILQVVAKWKAFLMLKKRLTFGLIKEVPETYISTLRELIKAEEDGIINLVDFNKLEK